MGAPHYHITGEQLRFLMSCAFSLSQMAEILHVSRSTVKRRLRRLNLSQAGRFSDLSDTAMDDKVKDLVAGNDRVGPESVRAQLRAEGIRVQRRRVRDSMVRVNPRAVALRAMSQRLHRRSYCVTGPNSLWHLDGNHQLIRWRIVIHGGIDGYSRLVVFLRASSNNRSSTVMDCFMKAVTRYGVPSRVRTDHGGENNAVCLFMNIFRGSCRGSTLRGRSTHNQRIERLWGDLWRGLTNVYYHLFNFLESEGIVDIDNEMHVWALHYVYLPRINRDMADFCQQWNHHGLRTERHQSPLQIFVRTCLVQQRLPTTAMQDLFAATPTGGERADSTVPRGMDGAAQGGAAQGGAAGRGGSGRGGRDTCCSLARESDHTSKPVYFGKCSHASTCRTNQSPRRPQNSPWNGHPARGHFFPGVLK
ncbi:uncharacterized protein LOC124470086 [Hypomesus transpacificus]|uniref:uncharacterized protein LOC124470086 n=1 Tax=Hypomesus transpacificus TaxID=137520 RepID=UPI001F07AE02|nr:uncharacterized protein LOC124470086 [Hypomesus transpacificus]XP_046879761.1 uncharacterized protein LOC124470086 [Hypomesus transpacificus]XP_046879763.1 uncharacterized protein LOC124470086 [Hypomesus transpacificus]XP_046879764.1 uncharacterized protein LOC124470086 [Hypomesus transpacificus]XP_046879765.1 uncharacterized protein LOC124470086 [Hypomesus transpacificus]